jgi:hypothetical protein
MDFFSDIFHFLQKGARNWCGDRLASIYSAWHTALRMPRDPVSRGGRFFSRLSLPNRAADSPSTRRDIRADTNSFHARLAHLSTNGRRVLPMIGAEREMLHVDVPVGFLLHEPREIAVSVDRPSDTPLSIRLRLIPAQADSGPITVMIDREMTPRAARGPRLARHMDGYPDPEIGGGD